MLVVRNTCDPPLSHYFMVEGARRSGSGDVGFPWDAPRWKSAARIDGTGQLGNNHDMDKHTRSHIMSTDDA